MADILGGYLVAKALKRQGVKCIFMLCGGHITPIYMGCHEEGIRLIDVRHEQTAGYAADAWARVTKKPGVAMVTAGPGVTNAVTAIANAHRAEVPVVVIGGRSPRKEFEKGSLQEMDHTEVLRPITKWARCIPAVDRIPDYVDIAFRKAAAGRPGPVFLEIPVDLLLEVVSESNIVWPDQAGNRAEARPWGDPALVREAAGILAEAKKPVVMGGSPLWWAGAAPMLRKFAEKTRFPIFLNAMGRGALPPNHPYLFSYARRHALTETDAVVTLGVPLDFRMRYGRAISPKAKWIQAEIDSGPIGHNRAPEVGIVGDMAAVLEQLLDEIGEPRDELPWITELRDVEKERSGPIVEKCARAGVPINHYRLIKEFNEMVDKETIVIGDGGDIVVLAGRIIKVHEHGHWMDPGPMGVLGVGLPFAMAAKAARPEKKVLVLNGDGAFGITAMDFDTLVRFNLPVVLVIGNDAGWGQMRAPQIMLFGDDKSVGTDLSVVTRYDKMAEAMGGHGERVTEPRQIRPAIQRALDSGKPAVVDVVLDPRGLADEANTRELAI
jgi:acetolactate synthase-1/2/3 large subunit